MLNHLSTARPLHLRRHLNREINAAVALPCRFAGGIATAAFVSTARCCWPGSARLLWCGARGGAAAADFSSSCRAFDEFSSRSRLPLMIFLVPPVYGCNGGARAAPERVASDKNSCPAEIPHRADARGFSLEATGPHRKEGVQPASQSSPASAVGPTAPDRRPPIRRPEVLPTPWSGSTMRVSSPSASDVTAEDTAPPAEPTRTTPSRRLPTSALPFLWSRVFFLSGRLWRCPVLRCRLSFYYAAAGSPLLESRLRLASRLWGRATRVGSHSAVGTRRLR